MNGVKTTAHGSSGIGRPAVVGPDGRAARRDEASSHGSAWWQPEAARPQASRGHVEGSPGPSDAATRAWLGRKDHGERRHMMTAHAARTGDVHEF
jgi:hypothetical protein